MLPESFCFSGGSCPSQGHHLASPGFPRHTAGRHSASTATYRCSKEAPTLPPQALAPGAEHRIIES